MSRKTRGSEKSDAHGKTSGAAAGGASGKPPEKATAEKKATKAPVQPAPAEADLEKLKPFMELIGKAPNEKVAEMAGVAVEVVAGVAKTIAKVEAVAGGVADAVADAVASERAETPKKSEPVAPKKAPPEKAHAEKKATAERKAAVATDGAPAAVQVRRSMRIPGPQGKPMRFNLGDVFTGALAEFLWRTARKYVIGYPRANRKTD